MTEDIHTESAIGYEFVDPSERMTINSLLVS